MAETNHPRFPTVRQWSAGTDTPSRAEIDASLTGLADAAVKFSRDADLLNRPAASAATVGALFEHIDALGPGRPVLYWCDGATWHLFRRADDLPLGLLAVGVRAEGAGHIDLDPGSWQTVVSTAPAVTVPAGRAIELTAQAFEIVDVGGAGVAQFRFRRMPAALGLADARLSPEVRGAGTQEGMFAYALSNPPAGTWTWDFQVTISSGDAYVGDGARAIVAVKDLGPTVPGL